VIVLYSATYGWWKIADLGLSSPAPATSASAVTTNDARGKTVYRAPEVPGERTYNKMADIWSLGCILHVLCLGAPAFQSDFEVGQYVAQKKPLKFILPERRNSMSQFTFATWIRAMMDWDRDRRPSTEELGSTFWEVLQVLEGIEPSTKASWDKFDFLSPCNLLSTDLPSNNLAMSQEIPPRWEHMLIQGAPYSHHRQCLKTAADIAAAREKILGRLHPFTVHSKVRSAWTSHFTCPRDTLADEFQTLIDETGETNVRLIASYHAGLARTSDSCEESIKSFDMAVEILNKAVDPATSPEGLSYSVASLDKQIEAQLDNPPNKTCRKRKRTAKSEDVATQLPELPSIKIDRALSQMRLEYSTQRRHLGRNHPETVETMVNIGAAYKALAFVKGREGATAKVLEKYHFAKEESFRDALEILCEYPGDDHPETLWVLSEVGQMDLDQGCTAEGKKKLERALEQQRYILGDDDEDTLATAERLEQLYEDIGEHHKIAALPEKGKAVASGNRRVRQMVPEVEGDMEMSDWIEASSSNS
jgi:serine/threonine protein kinase